MKNCDACRFVFTAKFGENQHKLCRGAPPTPIVSTTVERGQTTTHIAAMFPPIPVVRCGAFKRRWPWMRNA